MIAAAAKLRFAREEIVLADGRTVGEALAAGRDRWIEEEVLGPAFALNEQGLPRFSLVDLEVARGHWKSGGAAAIGITEAVLEPGTEVVIAAGDVEQAAIVLTHLDGFLERSPRLASLFRAKGNERIAEGGSRIRVIASDAPTAWGLGGTHRRFRVICDELTIWRGEDLWSALVSATGKVPDAQVLVLSNAGFDAERAWQWRVREAARTESWGYLYSPAGVVASWISDEWVEQQRALLPPVAFERVILNRWTSAAGDFVTAEQWQRCVDERLAPRTSGTGRFYGGLDLGLTKDRTALAIVHADGDEVVLDELTVWEGTRAEPVSITTIERAVADASQRFLGVTIAADPWQLKGSIERLQREHVEISEFVFSAGSVQKLSATLHHAITSANLRVYADDELAREILGLRVVQTGGGWRFDHRTGGYSDRAVAVAMAIQLAQKNSDVGFGSVVIPKGRIRGIPKYAPSASTDPWGIGARDPLAERLAAAGVPVWNAAAARAQLDEMLHRGRSR